MLFEYLALLQKVTQTCLTLDVALTNMFLSEHQRCVAMQDGGRVQDIELCFGFVSGTCMSPTLNSWDTLGIATVFSWLLLQCSKAVVSLEYHKWSSALFYFSSLYVCICVRGSGCVCLRYCFAVGAAAGTPALSPQARLRP